MFNVRLKGGLGNQMFQYAFAKSKQLITKQDFTIDLRYINDRSPRKGFVFRNYDLDVFDLSPNFYSKRHYLKYFIYFHLVYEVLLKKIIFLFKISSKTYIEQTFKYDSIAIQSSFKNHIGYFQSYRYFESFENEIRNDFKFKYKINFDNNVLAREINDCNSVCINVRRGDFVDDKSLGIKSKSYYNEALTKLKSIVNQEDIVLFVFSDDIEWCKENLDFNLKTKFIEHNYSGFKFSEYLQLMIFCKYFIIPNSSFAWWAAYLSERTGKIVLVPEKWHNYHSEGEDEDLVLDSWIRVKI